MAHTEPMDDCVDCLHGRRAVQKDHESAEHFGQGVWAVYERTMSRLKPQSTHWEGCYAHHGHSECAVAEVDTLRGQLERECAHRAAAETEIEALRKQRDAIGAELLALKGRGPAGSVEHCYGCIDTQHACPGIAAKPETPSIREDYAITYGDSPAKPAGSADHIGEAAGMIGHCKRCEWLTKCGNYGVDSGDPCSGIEVKTETPSREALIAAVRKMRDGMTSPINDEPYLPPAVSDVERVFDALARCESESKGER